MIMKFHQNLINYFRCHSFLRSTQHHCFVVVINRENKRNCLKDLEKIFISPFVFTTLIEHVKFIEKIQNRKIDE